MFDVVFIHVWRIFTRGYFFSKVFYYKHVECYVETIAYLFRSVWLYIWFVVFCRDSIEFLSSEGHIYSTIDDEHYKPTDSWDVTVAIMMIQYFLLPGEFRLAAGLQHCLHVLCCVHTQNKLHHHTVISHWPYLLLVFRIDNLLNVFHISHGSNGNWQHVL